MNILLNRKASLSIMTLLVLAIIMLMVVVNSGGAAETNTEWKKVGEGNLGVLKIEKGWLLYPKPTTYIAGLQNAQGKEYKMGTKKAYFIDSERTGNFQSIVANELPLTLKNKMVNKREKKYFVIEDHLFSEQNNSNRINKSEIVEDADDYSNLWLVSDNGVSKPLLNTDGYEHLQKKIYEDSKNMGEDKYSLLWAADSRVFNDGNLIAYISNKNVVDKGKSDQSVYTVNQDGSNEKVIIDSQIYGNVRLVGVGNNIIVAHNPENFSIIVADLATNQLKQYDINGWAEDLSPDGNNVLFRKVIDFHIQKDLWVINLQTGVETQIQGFPEGYFYNIGGSWSPDGKKFAFYANGWENIDKNKVYRDNNLLAILDVTTNQISSYSKPNIKGSIYPLGDVQWITNNYVLTYLDDDTSWLLDAKTNGGE